MVKLDGKMAMAVLPASLRVNLDLLKEASGANDVDLAAELEFRELFPECNRGRCPLLETCTECQSSFRRV